MHNVLAVDSRKLVYFRTELLDREHDCTSCGGLIPLAAQVILKIRNGKKLSYYCSEECKLQENKGIYET